MGRAFAAVRNGPHQLDDEALAEARRRFASRHSTVDRFQRIAIAAVAFERAYGLPPSQDALAAAVAALDRGAISLDDPQERAASACLYAAAAATAGRSLHLLTIDDTRTGEVAAIVAPVLERLGIGVGAVTSEQSAATRHHHYAAPVTVVSVANAAADFMRDAAVSDGPLDDLRLRIDALCGSRSLGRRRTGIRTDIAFLDEIDTVMCVHALATISIPIGAVDRASQLATQAAGLAALLVAGADFTEESGRAVPSDAGKERMRSLGRFLGPPWTELSLAEQTEVVAAALTAAHCLVSGRDYEVKAGNIEVIAPSVAAEASARLVPFLEMKEGVAGTRRRNPLQMSIGRFVGKYRRAVGVMIGASLWAGELRRRHGIAARERHRSGPQQIVIAPDALSASRIIVEVTRAARSRGCPVLMVGAVAGRLREHALSLKAHGIESARMSASDGGDPVDLLRSELTNGNAVVLVAASLANGSLASALPAPLQVLLVDCEEALVSPWALAARLSQSRFELCALTVVRRDSAHVAEGAYGLDRLVMTWLGQRRGWLSQLFLSLALRRILQRVARKHERQRTMASMVEAQRLARLGFAGEIIARL